MARLAWGGIGVLWLSAGIVLVLIVADVEDDPAPVAASDRASPSDGNYTLVAFVSPRTVALLADPPGDSRIAFEFVDSAEAVLDRLAAPEIAGVILDRSTAGQVERGPLSHWYRNSKLIVSFEIRPSHVLAGRCEEDAPCPLTLHENEPAIAWTRRTPTQSNAGQTVVHPFSPHYFHTVLAMRADNARGIGIGGPATPARSQ